MGSSKFTLGMLLLAFCAAATAAPLPISGRVTAAAGGQGLAGIEIRAYGRQPPGSLIATTNANGDYAVQADLPPGDYRIVAESPPAAYYIGRGYPDSDCSGICTGYEGNSFAVPSAQPQTNIDFALNLGGRLQFRVKATDSNLPLAGANVYLASFDTGTSLRSAASAADGLINLPPLPAGNYVAALQAPNGYISERYPNQHCNAFDCPLDGATTFGVPAAATATIDFSLERSIGIRGRLLDPQGQPAAGLVMVYTRNGGGGPSTQGVAGADGFYETRDELPPGSYGLMATPIDDHLAPTVYPNLACARCDPRGTGNAVQMGTQTLTNIDFHLGGAGVIRGALSLPWENFVYAIDLYSAVTREPQPVYDRYADGSYRIPQLLPGTYYVSVRALIDWPYTGELYNGIACAPMLACDLDQGTPVQVSAGQTASGIDLRIRTDVIFAGVFD